ncbi:unnamed protein product [Clonostachys chloroleuca]|uniref:Uncharacterized protein n=1 Tax=Clonostachys chloroleuca TaxID=1926264 RepID=A0AA35MCT1_9HYPO|nr:unnamed protein product [Clonostachys chloroleuca]
MHPHLKLELTRRRMTALSFKESLRRKSEGSESGTAAHGHSPAKVNSHFFLTIQAKVNSHFFILQTSANSPLFAILQPPETLKLDGFCNQITPLTSFSAVCRIIDPDETFDPRSDPRSAFPPAIRDGLGDFSEPLTRGFLKEKICACWNLTGISTFFPLMHSNRTLHRTFLFRTTFSNLSIKNCTILWRAAQKFSIEEASNELGEAFAKVYASYDSEDDIKGRSEVEDEAFRILSTDIRVSRSIDFSAYQSIDFIADHSMDWVPTPTGHNCRTA